METISKSDDLVLSLCIPTYNRLPLLREALSAVIDQIDDKIVPLVEILISNNASTDKTEEYVKEIMATHPHLQIRYFCNEENLGCDTNIYRITKQAKGVWIYMLSDDDIFLPGGLEKLLFLIKKYPDFDAFCLNVCGFKINPYTINTPIFDISKDLILKNKDDALCFLGRFGITFISTLAFRKQIIDERDHLDKIGTSLRHSYIYLDALSKGNGLYVTHQYFIAGREGNSGGYNFLKVFISNFYEVMIYAKHIGYSPLVINKILTEVLWKLIPDHIVNLKLDKEHVLRFGTIKIKELVKMLFPIYSDVPVLIPSVIPTVLLFLSPRKFLILLKMAKTSLKLVITNGG